MIEIKDLSKTYRSKKRKCYGAIKGISLTLPSTGLVFLLGKSGSGKSTLLNIIGGLDSPSEGKVCFNGRDISAYNSAELADYRNREVGFVFQDYHLIDNLTVWENVSLALELAGDCDTQKIREALETVGIAELSDRYPSEISGGERQRVCVARALVKSPGVILADEPTGNLDSDASDAVFELLREISRRSLVFVVSHNAVAAQRFADRIIELSGGKVLSDSSINPKYKNPGNDGDFLCFEGEELSDGDSTVEKQNKYIPTGETETVLSDHTFRKSGMPFTRKIRLCGRMLRGNLMKAVLYSIMVAAVMVVMALSQTVAEFDASDVMRRELAATDSDSIYVTKTLTAGQRRELEKLKKVANTFPRIYEDDIRAFRDAGYSGEVYEVLKYAPSISGSQSSAGMKTSFFDDSFGILEPLGTMVVDEKFLEDKFGKVKYLAKAEEFHPTGVIITDYIADIIINSGQVSYAHDYDSLIGEYRWGTKSEYSCVTRGYINAVIDTGYRDKYKKYFDIAEKLDFGEAEKLLESESVLDFIDDVHSSYGFCYSLNPDFRTDAENSPAWDTVWHYALSIDGGEKFTTDIPQVRRDDVYGISLGEDELLMDCVTYNRVFGTDYSVENFDSFEGHTFTLRHYLYSEQNGEPLFEKEVKVVGLFKDGSRDMCGTFIVGEGIYSAFLADHVYPIGLYFNGKDGLDRVINVATEQGFEKNLAVTDSLGTMSKAVEVFVPVFRLMALILCAGVIFVLMNFASKTVTEKRHEIGILKALGMKNPTVGFVFVFQVVLIAALTVILTCVGYSAFVSTVNGILTESLQTFVSGRVILKLDFISFDSTIMLKNAAFTVILAFISFIIPMIRICRVDPVKIIRVRD